MKPVITPEEAARLDAAAADPVEVLMDRAGLAVALAAAEMGAGYGSRVAVLAGPGNNGGDGYVAARYLAERGAFVRVHALGYPKGDDSAARRAALAAGAAGVRTVPLGGREPADLVIDALFGAGFHGDVPERARAWARPGPPVLAVDVPTGLDGATGAAAPGCFTADRTVTFHALKVGHVLGEGPDRCGRVRVADIGLDGGTPELRLCERVDARRPARPRTAHKWSAGAVLVVGGSPGLTGAPLLTARAALGFGAGAVAVACPGGLSGVYDGVSPELMTVAVGAADRFEPADADELVERAARFDVLALGPGLGPDQEKFVGALLARWHGPVVADADGLNAIGERAQVAARRGDTILTPHAGEFTRLTGVDADFRSAADLAARARATVVLKGNPTIVAGGESWVVTTGGPELATIGTGDVLTGMIAALWARGLSPERAARSGAFWHGAAGAELARRGSVTADRLAAAVGRWAFAPEDLR